MKVFIRNKEFQFENDIESIDEIMDTIHEEVDVLDEVLESLVVNGQEIYIDYGEYLFENISNIKEIKVQTVTVKKLIENILVTTSDYLGNSKVLIEKLAERLEESMEEVDIKNMNDLLEGVEWIIESFFNIDKDPKLTNKIERKEEWSIYAARVYELTGIAAELVSAFSKQNHLLISDILEDQIIPVFEDMEEIITKDILI